MAAVVQSTALAVGGFPSQPQSFSSTPTVGNTVVVSGSIIESYGPFTSVVVTDNQGNSYTVQTGYSDDPASIAPRCGFVAYAPIVTASGTFTVTAAVSGGSADSGVSIKLQEVSGLDNSSLLADIAKLEQTFPDGTNTNLTVDTDTDDSFLVGAGTALDTIASGSAPSGWTENWFRATGEGRGASLYRVAGAAGSYSANFDSYFPNGINRSGILLVALRATAGGGGGNRRRRLLLAA